VIDNRTTSHGLTEGAFDIEVSGVHRRYLVIQPNGIDAAGVPTIIDLHGSGSWPAEHAAVTDARTFAALGAVIVVPQAGIPFRLLAGWPEGWAWNVPGSPLPGESVARDEPDDMAFVEALIDRLISRHGADPRRIHLRGYSGGARLSSHLMAAMGRRFASVCCVGGIRFVAPDGALPRLLAVHGALDAINPYAGGAGPRWDEPVESVISQWASASQCVFPPQRRVLSGAARETRYVDGDGLATVRLITVADAAHSWPGTADRDHIAQFGAPGTFRASQASWDFLHEAEWDPTTTR
jgi:polyhydroxybutyrate depolymerase